MLCSAILQTGAFRSCTCSELTFSKSLYFCFLNLGMAPDIIIFKQSIYIFAAAGVHGGQKSKYEAKLLKACSSVINTKSGVENNK